MLGLKSNKYIREMLLLSEELTALVNPDNIKAMYLSPTSFPFISYVRVYQEANYDKGYLLTRSVQDRVEINLAVVSQDYDESIEIATAVRNALEFKTFKDSADNILIDEVQMLNAYEEISNDVYVQYLTFSLSIQNLK